jgi:hypothetical protein
MRVRLFPLVRVFFGLLLATGCGSSNQRSSSGNTQGSTPGWNTACLTIRRWAARGTWYFDFPTDPNYPACITNPDVNCKSVGYVTDSYGGPFFGHGVSVSGELARPTCTLPCSIVER